MKKWRKVSVDDYSIDEDRYMKFKNIVDSIEIEDNLGPEQFPRKTSKQAIKSYGIIAVSEENDYIKYFMTQRRTSIEFDEMVKCGPRKKYLHEYFQNMTPYEREMLMTEDHQTLWDDLLLDHKDLFGKTRDRSEKVFNSFKPYFKDLINLTNCCREEPPWEFPKGRMSKSDKTTLQAAIRELYEEGLIKIAEIILMWENSITVVHRGTDNQLYSTTYYVVKTDYQEPKYTPSPKNVLGEEFLSRDTRAYKWVSLPKTGHLIKGSTDLPKKLERELFNLHRNLTN